MGDMRGRALFVSKSGACAGTEQWNDLGNGGHGTYGAGCAAGWAGPVG